MLMNPKVIALTVAGGCILASVNSAALNTSTHALVNKAAAQHSLMDRIMRKHLYLQGGLAHVFGGKSALDWIAEGGIREDDAIRFLRHFHDPLQPWDTAGLDFFVKFQSSIHWMQRPTTCDAATWRDGQDGTWGAARCSFFHALTQPSADDRELGWAHTLRALGQAMHLVVDASVPEHTRDDPHPLGPVFGNYEYWVQSLHDEPEAVPGFVATYLANPVRPDPVLLSAPTNDAAAPVPVARLIDADRYTGQDPNLTLSAPVGVAEFANANFFSEDSGYRRFLAPTYPHPSIERLETSAHPVPGGTRTRAYYKKGRDDGRPVDPVLAECVLDQAFRDDGLPTPQRKCTDATVWAQTAAAMLPRAVGHAATLLDYFFRGQIGAGMDEHGRGELHARRDRRGGVPPAARGPGRHAARDRTLDPHASAGLRQRRDRPPAAAGDAPRHHVLDRLSRSARRRARRRRRRPGRLSPRAAVPAAATATDDEVDRLSVQ
jgi:hypothetical protein